jgi:trimeric autotransporter adhesin
MASPDRHFAAGALFTETAAPGTPNANDVWLYPKSDKKFHFKDDTGAEFSVGTIAGTSGTVASAIIRASGTGGGTIASSDLNVDDATTSTANNVAITNQHAGQTNSALVLTPKGDGAFILGPKPDGTVVGGNARGIYAVDLQYGSRSAATQVASGAYAVVAGYRSTGSGPGGVVAIGPQCSSTGNASVAIGNQALASGSGATCIGGATSGSGNGNQATATSAATLGGQRASADRAGMHAHAMGQFAAIGDAQRARFVMRNKTTTNAAVELFLDGSATRLTIPSGKYLTGTINIAGIKSDGTAAASYIRQFSIKNVAGTTSLVGTVNTVGTDEAASTSISITANDTNDALKVEVTGITSETWRWVAAVDVVEVAYGA